MKIKKEKEKLNIHFNEKNENFNNEIMKLKEEKKIVRKEKGIWKEIIKGKYNFLYNNK